MDFLFLYQFLPLRSGHSICWPLRRGGACDGLSLENRFTPAGLAAVPATYYLELFMPEQSDTSRNKRHQTTQPETKTPPNVPFDDQPQHEDEYLSKFLRDSNPESKEDRKGGK